MVRPSTMLKSLTWCLCSECYIQRVDELMKYQMAGSYTWLRENKQSMWKKAGEVSKHEWLHVTFLICLLPFLLIELLT